MTKAVLDTNVFLSALFWGGAPLEALRLILSKKIVGVISVEILEEVEKKLRIKFEYPEEQTQAFLTLILENFELVEPKQKIAIVKDDPNDNKIVEAALEAKANFIVSGDKHLLKIKEFQGIKIVKPKEFLSLI